jgi:hypothetical protein
MTSQDKIDAVVVGAALIQIIACGVVAGYDRDLGYPWFPLFVASLVFPLFGWVVVLFVVTSAAGPRLATRPRHPADTRGPAETRAIPRP